MVGNYSTIVSVVTASAASCDTTMVLVTAEALAALGLLAAQAADFGAKAGAITTAYGDKRVFAVGLGPAADVTSESLRAAVTAGVKALKAAKASAADIVLPAGLSLSTNRAAADVTLAAVLADYSFDIYINDEERKFHIERLSVISDAADAVEMAYKVAKGQCAAKDLANTRAGVATPQYMEDRAAQLVSTQTIRRCLLVSSRPFLTDCLRLQAAEYPGLTMNVVTEEEMIEKGMGLIYGVGKAASSGPRIVYLEYKGDPSSSDTVRTEAICRCVLFMGIF